MTSEDSDYIYPSAKYYEKVKRCVASECYTCCADTKIFYRVTTLGVRKIPYIACRAWWLCPACYHEYVRKG